MGEVVTFFSYKGGVGRSMALANTGLLLAQWGHNVLLIDWDLEAPGLETFFQERLATNPRPKQGVVDLIHQDLVDAHGARDSWQKLVSAVEIGDSPGKLSILAAGSRDELYFKKVRSLDIKEMYSKNRGGEAIEAMRTSWKEAYDFVLVDSRTGITDVGGICTVQLPDILVMLSTATEQSLLGTVDVARKAQRARQKLPFERFTVPVLPLACRIDNTEFNLSRAWMDKFALEFAAFFAEWLPRDIETRDVVETLKLPYIPYFSFGEKLAVLEQGTLDPAGLGYAYETLAGLIANKLNHADLLLLDRSNFIRNAKPEANILAIEIDVREREGSPWQVRFTGNPAYQIEDLLSDTSLLADIGVLRRDSLQALPTEETGVLAPEAIATASALKDLSIAIGERLTNALLSPTVKEALDVVVRSGIGGEPPLLRIQVRSALADDEADRRADRVLSLPWELLRLNGRFLVEDSVLDLAREALVPGVPGLSTPTKSLSVVVTIAAPVDTSGLDYEEEMYRLWLAFGREAEEQRLLVTDVGTLDELTSEVERFHPPVIHFSGHSKPGVLLFEDEGALSDEVPVDELVRRMREAGPLPQLVYLSTSHSSDFKDFRLAEPETPELYATVTPEDTPASTAASLHRAGFSQVVAYFGPVGDRQASRAAAAFYTALASGKKAREALRRARRVSTEPQREGERATHVYPLGWMQLALYHRGEDVPTTLLPHAGDPPIDLAKRQRRIFERLDRTGGSERVEGILGVHRLRFGFVGRRKERAEAIRRWRNGERQLVVLGLGGLGKTTLCAELAPFLARALKPGGSRILALDGRHAGAQPNPILALWQEFQAVRSDDTWSQTLAGLQEDGLTGEALGRVAIALAELEDGLLIYLDDVESLQVPLGEGEIGRFRNPELRAFWDVLLLGTGTAGPLGLLASSRYLPEGTPQEAELHLSQLRRYETVRLLAWMPTLGRLPIRDRVWLAEKVDGHPRTIEYLEVLARAREKQRVRPGGRYEGKRWREEILEPVLPKTQEKVDADLLLGKVWEALPEDAQEHLGRCTVITSPAPWDAVLALETIEGTTARLIETGMLSPSQSPLGPEDWWAPHRLVSEEARKHWRGEPREAHHKIGEWYERKWEDEKQQVWAERAVQHLTDAGEGDAAWPGARSVIIRLRNAGRYREALAWIERVLAADPTGPQLGNALAYQVQIGRNASVLPVAAEGLLLQALELVEPEDQSFVLDELGKLAQRKGELRKAADYLERSVQVETTLKGENYRNVASSLHALAGVLQDQGDLDGARRNLERSLQIQAQVFGTDIHPEVAATLHTLAGVLKDQGDLDGARRNLERSLQIQAQVFGTDIHPDVAASLHVLASVLQAQGDLDSARRNLERSLQIQAQIFGTEIHPSVAASLHQLAGVLQDQGDLDGARRNLERSLQIQAQIFGTEVHPDVAASLHALAGVLKDQGDLDGARRNIERSLQIKAQVFGTEIHPDVAASLHELAGVLKDQGDLDGARKNLEKVLEIEAVVYGTQEHYSTAITETSLGFLLLQAGETETGAKLLAHAYSVFLKQLGPEHPYTRQLAELFGKEESS